MPIIGNTASGGKKPTTPTIGTATDGGTGTTVSVAFTPSTYIGKGTITYTATSSPGSLTGTGSGSPITVSGLTTGTAYTFTVKGDTNYGVASDNSAASNSVTPASPSSYESIATLTGTGTNVALTFTSIPSTYKSLQIRYAARAVGGGTGGADMKIIINGATSGYAAHSFQGNNSTVSAAATSSTTQLYANVAGTSLASNPQLASTVGVGIIDIIDYASTSKNKVLRIFGGTDLNSATTSTIYLTSNLLVSTSAITSIEVSANSGFSTSSTIALYGVK